MSPCKAYNDMKHHANARGIEFLLSYEEFLELWLVSGKWNNRGKRSGQYQICRNYDEGPYSVTNCYIGSTHENQKERHRIPDGQTGEIISKWITGNYSQYQLAEMFDLTQSSISKIVNKKRRINEVYS